MWLQDPCCLAHCGPLFCTAMQTTVCTCMSCRRVLAAIFQLLWHSLSMTAVITVALTWGASQDSKHPPVGSQHQFQAIEHLILVRRGAEIRAMARTCIISSGYKLGPYTQGGYVVCYFNSCQIQAAGQWHLLCKHYLPLDGICNLQLGTLKPVGPGARSRGCQFELSILGSGPA